MTPKEIDLVFNASSQAGDGEHTVWAVVAGGLNGARDLKIQVQVQIGLGADSRTPRFMIIIGEITG